MDTKIFLVTALVLPLFSVINAFTEEKDVRVGESVVLNCKFPQALLKRNLTYIWQRSNMASKDSIAAIGLGLFEERSTYRLKHDLTKGLYDLEILSATYDRDNAKFVCKAKEAGIGHDLFSHTIDLTVLVPPEPPIINPSEPVATEGKPYELTCSSIGGSPSPTITWYKSGVATPLLGETEYAENRLKPTTSTITITPTKEDDGARYRCVVFNKAIDYASRKEVNFTLAVNYFPRIEVGPHNPLRVERGGTAHLTCSVDAKPAVSNVRWSRNGQFISTSYRHTLKNVEIEDSGIYVCSAENSLGEPRQAELKLDTLYAPIVSLDERYEVQIGDDVSFVCNVSANPDVSKVYWTKQDTPDFQQEGEVLRFVNVGVHNAGIYSCHARNAIDGKEREGSATMRLLVRHKPGVAKIIPSNPVGIEGQSLTLRCLAEPEGYPKATFTWKKAGSEPPLALASEYTIQPVKLTSEGIYVCQAVNEIGLGAPAEVEVKVYQPPQITRSLLESVQRSSGEPGFSLMCAASGKPKPTVSWLKNGETIDSEHGLFKIMVEDHNVDGKMIVVTSKLIFEGQERLGINQLQPLDSGKYSCIFENQVRKAETKMSLKIEHSPIALSEKNVVAFDIGEDAILLCRMKAFPQPTVEWQTGNSVISADGKRHDINVTMLKDDTYLGVLRIIDVRESDYGDYRCKALNRKGEQKTVIRLQPKGPPSQPTNVHPLYTGHNHVVLQWSSGFNGGYDNTVYSVVILQEDGSAPREVDCQDMNPCNVTGLEQLHEYIFRVRASNLKGYSNFSDPLTLYTTIDLSSIPEPQLIYYDSSSRVLGFNVLPSPFPLSARIEIREPESGEWLLYSETPVRSYFRDTINVQGGLDEESVRVALCADGTGVCGEPMLAKTGDAHPTLAPERLASPYFIAILCSGLAGFLFLLLVGVYLCIRRRRQRKQKKALALETPHHQPTRTALVPSAAPPPPYYPAGVDNKGRNVSIDSSLDDAIKGHALYATQNGYGYQAQPAANAGGINMAYTENSYSNSNHGGSVNSQDSIWQLKHGQPENHVQYPSYDPITHGGYGTYDDYSHYPPTSEVDYGRNREYSMNGQYTPKREHEASYHNVSGLPNPYLDTVDGEDQKPVHQSMSFDESLESGYSTPNSRNRRVIREIIV
ncbi:hemicentin-1-like isoform X2 [Artemia franciscana]|uniref:hemicentin-1-like isoform X2 n=1 Tax=Artemia franciscana TaxID=6661 RepID=UPI0032DA09B3